ncbi:MAG: hypothetical protein ACE5K1_08280 [Acidiferrobacterales bacterium]
MARRLADGDSRQGDHHEGGFAWLALHAAQRTSRAAFIFLLLLLLLLLSTPRAWAQQQGSDFINYAYATWIGTGRYDVADRTVTILRAPIAIPLAYPKEKKWDMKILLPVTLGRTDFDFALSDIETLDTITFIPGVEFRVPILENWDLKPFVQAGIGKDFQGGDLAYIYGGGLKSLATFPWKKFIFGLGNRLMAAGQTIKDGGSDNGFSLFEVGFDVLLPMRTKTKRGRLSYSVFFIQTQFQNKVDFPDPIFPDTELSRLSQIGFTVGFEKHEFSFWKFDLPRVGLSYMDGDAGFSGVRINAGFPF